VQKNNNRKAIVGIIKGVVKADKILAILTITDVPVFSTGVIVSSINSFPP
jgi:hypothetical protein